MSLVTRCTACATLFRVAQDQLRASDGWVRCGRCDTVFDALETLDDHPQEDAQALPTRNAAGMLDAEGEALVEPIDVDALLKRRVEAQIVRPAAEPDATDSDSSHGSGSSRGSGSSSGSGPSSGSSSSPGSSSSRGSGFSRDLAPRGETHVTALNEPSDPAGSVDSLHPLEPAEPPIEPAETRTQPPPIGSTGAGPTPKPHFVRRAERDARWHSPAMRAALIGTSLILLLMLGAQAAYHHRDRLAARSPFAAGLLDAACERWNCAIQAPRLLDSVVIEHSALSRVPDRPDALQLSLRIANRNDTKVTVPAVELSLTNAEGQLIARRALLPAHFGIESPAVIAARTERPLELLLTAGDRVVSGFSVELFHP